MIDKLYVGDLLCRVGIDCSKKTHQKAFELLFFRVIGLTKGHAKIESVDSVYKVENGIMYVAPRTGRFLREKGWTKLGENKAIDGYYRNSKYERKMIEHNGATVEAIEVYNHDYASQDESFSYDNVVKWDGNVITIDFNLVKRY